MTAGPAIRWPETPEEWREAIAAAVFCLGLHAAQAYGLVTGPDVDVDRVEGLLEAARDQGYCIPPLDDVLAPRSVEVVLDGSSFEHVIEDAVTRLHDLERRTGQRGNAV